MPSAPIEYEELIRFLYQCPVGIAQIDPRGAVSLLNAKGSQILMPYARSSGLDNLFDVLDPHDASLRPLAASREEYGTLCEHRLVRLESPDPLLPRYQHLAFTLLKIGPETIMAVFEDVTRVVEAEAEARNLLTSAAIESGRSELAAEVLHDIGNAMVGIGTRTATLLEDSHDWAELVQLKNLGAFFSARAEAMAASLGAKKSGALVRLVGEIDASLEGRRRGTEESMQSFMASVHHIQEILNLHRHYARPTSKGFRERISLEAIVEDALTIQEASLQKRSIAIERRISPGLPKLSIDRTRMIQVLVNLLRNACESFDAGSPSGDRRIIVEIAATPDGSAVRMELRDNARGFDAGRAESFFEREVSTKSRGSGLGLYHCRKVVEAHGGTLVLGSDGPGLGATSSLILPDSPGKEAESC